MAMSPQATASPRRPPTTVADRTAASSFRASAGPACPRKPQIAIAAAMKPAIIG
jgi:hypothetical protein